MSAPVRIQLSRAKGWRMPENTVRVSRPGKWGNPFPWKGSWIVWAAVARGFRADQPGRVAAAIAIYREWLLGDKAHGPNAKTKSGGIIEYESGLALSVDEAARGMAATFAMMNSEKIRVAFPPTLADIRAELRGKNLACWCPLDQPCHADVLLELANAP